MVNCVVDPPMLWYIQIKEKQPNCDSMNAFTKTFFLIVHMKFNNPAKADHFLHREAYIHQSLRFCHFLHLKLSASYFPKFLFFQYLPKYFRT